MFCSNCGRQLIEGKKFCAYCGTPVETVATRPEAEAPQPTPVPVPSYPAQPTPAPQPPYPPQPAPTPQPTYPVQPQPTPAPQPAYQAQPLPTPAPQPTYPVQPSEAAWQTGTQPMAQPAPQTPAPQVPKSQPGKKKTRLIIVLAVAVVVVVAVAILIALVLVPSCSSDPKEQPAVEEPRENEPAVDREDAEGEPEDGNDSDNQGEEQEKPIDDERLGSFDGTLYESTTLPLSFMLPPDYTVDENRERILCASPTGLAQIQIYRIAGIKAADVAAEQENYNRDAINRFNGSLYEFTSAEDVVYYDTTWHRVIFKSNDADGNLINYWLTYTDDGSGGVVFCAYGLFFGPSGTASIDELSGLDIQESMKLDRAAI